MSLRIGIDVDGVLADFRSAFHAAAARCLRRRPEDGGEPMDAESLDERDVKRVWEYVARTPNWWLDLEPCEPEQIGRLYGMTRAAGWEVFFLTTRPASAGDTVQFQTQWWLERQGFYLPAVLTVPGSRGEVANGLRLDLVIDDLFRNCVEVVSASPAKALLLHRGDDEATRAHAVNRGIGVVSNLAEALAVVQRLEEVVPKRRGRLLRLSDWFLPGPAGVNTLPLNPRISRPVPPPKPR